jgi:hypothetical protein
MIEANALPSLYQMISYIVFIVESIVLGFVLQVAINFSHNLIFMSLKKPYLWIFSLIVLGFVNMFASTYFKDSLSVFLVGFVIAFAWSLPKRTHNKQEIVDKNETIYIMTGIKNGQRFYMVGLCLFLATSLSTWLWFYANSR